MADELVDYRGRITLLSDAMAEGEATSRGIDKAVVIREVVDAWARQRAHAASLAHAALLAEGAAGIVSGVSGSPLKQVG
jgi:hypothetical protein